MRHYHTIVVGAGVAGCCSAYMLQKEGVEVLLIDRSATPATGGSGAAGAFVSPKIGKGSPLQHITNEAFCYAQQFYQEHFPSYFHQTGVVRLPKDEEDDQRFSLYAQAHETSFEWFDEARLKQEGIESAKRGLFFGDAGVCDAPQLCQAMSKSVLFQQFYLEALYFEEGLWHLKSLEGEMLHSQHVILATGYENHLFDMRYMGVKGTWGSRGDYESATPLKVSMHQRISISANAQGIIKLGATHVKQKDAPHPCFLCDGKPLQMLEDEAKAMVDVRDFRLKETFCGMRAGSKDYFPLVGGVVNVPYMLENYPAVTRGAKPPLEYHPNLYVCNGLGGRGFVFAPLMAKWLSEHIVHHAPLDNRVNPDRLFLRWARRAFREENA